MVQRHTLTLLPHALIEAGYQSPGYRHLYEAARSARIPVHLGENGRWTFVLDDLAEIADRLGLDALAA